MYSILYQSLFVYLLNYQILNTNLQILNGGLPIYTELSYKITSLISRTCCLGSSGLTYTQADAGVMPFICNSYRTITTKMRSIHFNDLLLLISLETKTPHVRRCPFIFAVLYIQVPTVAPPNRWPGCIYDLPLYDTLYIINLQCTFSVGVMVSSLIQISTRSATINKPKGADNG